MVRKIVKRICAFVSCFLVIFVLFLSINTQNVSATALTEESVAYPVSDWLFKATYTYDGISVYRYFKLPLVGQGDAPIPIYDQTGGLIGYCTPWVFDDTIQYSFSFEILIQQLDITLLTPYMQADALTNLYFGTGFTFSASVRNTVIGSYRYLLPEFISDDQMIESYVGLQRANFGQALESNLAFTFGPLTAHELPIIITDFSAEVVFSEEDVSFTFEVPKVPQGGNTYYWQNMMMPFMRQWEVNPTYTELPTNWVSWLSNTAFSFFDFEIIPNFTFGQLIWVIIAIAVFAAFVHLLR